MLALLAIQIFSPTLVFNGLALFTCQGPTLLVPDILLVQLASDGALELQLPEIDGRSCDNN